MIIEFLRATIRMATPLMLAASGEAYDELAGVINLGIDGMMAVGAVSAVIGAYFTGNLWMGLLLGMVAGGLLGVLMAFLTTTLHLDQVICGIAMNILAGTGLSVVIYRRLFGTGGIVIDSPVIVGFADISIPLLSDIPIIGQILFNHNILVYLMLPIIIILMIVLYKTTIGLNIRSVGDNPLASEGLGVSVVRTRYLATIFAGIMCGWAGAYLSLAEIGTFFEGMIAGRGWIALSLVIFGQWNPLKILVGALLFGGVNALQMRIQVMGIAIPYQFLLMLPYILTIITLVIGTRRARPPAKLGIPYKKEE